MGDATTTTAETEHTHAKVGGGKLTHTHEDAGGGHGHDGEKLLPLPKPAKGGELDSDARDAVADKNFAYIDPQGAKKLPIHDASHVRAALSRFNQTDFHSDSAKAAAAKKIAARASSMGISVGSDSTVGKIAAGEPTVVALRFREPIALDEHEIPFLVTGEWHWPDYGKFTVTRDDLAEVYQHFHDNVRQQDLPVLNGDHANPGAKSPTTVFPGEAIGWVQDLRMKDPDTLVAEVDFNALGEELVAQKRFKYVSPELLRDYTDAESGRKYRLVAAGLDCSSDNRSMCAVTNFPRIKRLGRIAANEAGVEAWALRFGEVTADTPGHALRMKLEEDDGGEPDTAEDALATPCNWAPPNSSVGRCPGYTRGAGLMDGDGDQPGDTAGCCMLADRCNGYSPVSANGNGNSYVGLMSEGERHMGEHDENGANPGGTSGGVTDPVPPPSTANADAAETRNLLTAAEQRQTKLAEELATERRKREELEARLNAAERAKVIDAYRTRVDRLRDSNRITPAVHEKLAANESLLRFREDGRDPFLDALEQLPGTAIPMQEIGSGGDADHGTVDQGRLVVRMNELFAERSKGNPRYTYQDAAKAAADEVFGVRKGTQ